MLKKSLLCSLAVALPAVVVVAALKAVAKAEQELAATQFVADVFRKASEQRREKGAA